MKDSVRIKLLSYIREYHLIIIGFCLFLSILYINSFRISHIVFNSETPINDRIKTKIESSYKSLLCFNFCNIDYDGFSRELQLEYTSYPFINVYPKNNIIYVDIYDYATNYLHQENNVIGDVVAEKDGIVDTYYIYYGTNKVYRNKYVKKGEVLVGKELTEDKSVSASGLILAYTYEKLSIKVPKTQEEIRVTDNKQQYYQLSFLNNNFNFSKNNEFSLYDSTSSNVFNLFDFFTVKQIEEIEKNAIIKTYTKDTATEYAINKIQESFSNQKVTNEEKLVEIKPYHYVEEESSFTITFLLKKYESIGVFQKT